MSYWFLWYILISLVGLLSFPAAYRLLPGLKDRGYTISRTLGWLIWGYTFWLLASLGVLPFTMGGLIFSGLLLVGLAVWGLKGVSFSELKTWLQSQKRMVMITEFLFLIAFAGWSVVRAANPEAVGTEKPMELAFINAVLRSPTFPPHDPWLSGYGISYYYFGYVLTAMMAKFTGTSGSIAFNLGVSLVFALSAVGAYGIVYNLLNAAHSDKAIEKQSPRFSFASLLAPLFVLIISNLEGFLHSLHTRGLFWTRACRWQSQLRFLALVGYSGSDLCASGTILLDSKQVLVVVASASRVLQDYDLRGASKEIIDEFPFFSYLLADLHPHVLAMPFGFLAVTLALDLILSKEPDRAWMQKAGTFHFDVKIEPVFFLLAAIGIGGLAFLNTWDFPVYVFIFSAAFALAGRNRSEYGHWHVGSRFIGMGFALGLAGILLYLPFYLGFSSQAGGFLPNLIYPTRGIHLWVMFGSLLIPIFINMVEMQNLRHSWRTLLKGFGTAAAIMLIAWFVSLLLGWGITLIPNRGQIFLSSLGAENTLQVLQAAAVRRISAFGGWFSLLVLLGLILSLISRVFPNPRDHPELIGAETEASFEFPEIFHRAEVFHLLLIFTGLLLVLAPEFIYLLDMFGWRMNTIFKFYFLAWLLWSISAAYASIHLLIKLKGVKRVIFQAVLLLTIFAALFYPIFGIWNKTNGFRPASWTLDSSAYFSNSSPDEMTAIRWLKEAEFGVVAEAIPPAGGSYTEYARVSTLSGLPAVLGWVGHENQWRGGSEAMGSRLGDLERLYCSRDWEEARSILDQYNIRYVFVGNLERVTYQPNSGSCPVGLVDAKFKKNLNPVFQAGSIAIYEYTGAEK